MERYLACNVNSLLRETYKRTQRWSLRGREDKKSREMRKRQAMSENERKTEER